MRPLLVTLAIALLLGGLGVVALRHLPPEWDPREPLDLAAPPNAMTAWKLRRLGGDGEACRAAFDISSIATRPVLDRPSAVGCPIENAMLLPAAVAPRPNTPTVTCRLAAAWTLFERHTLQPAAREHLGSEVASIRHLGTFACRNVNHASSGRRSQHATANAIDIAGFVLADGREISLLRHWNEGAEPAAFLRAVRDGACRWFKAVLGPDHDAAHRDHFHFDMGPWRACR
ncbi:extensin-like domain-containing protein [Elioraea rosea]|uniref:extensin-like domain-containing protein n=1 Tax=Elioraea rosea TaxID=2492390 RepID=UPI0011838263|nr:extensin family protein [Elioraea rosea]